MNDVTVVIKTFRRPWCLAAAVHSASRCWPDVHEIIVLDDSPAADRVPEDERYRLLITEEDIGLSAGRNRLVEAVETPLLFMIDDDFLAGPDAQLDVLAEIVRQGECDMVAPAIREAEGYWNGGWVYRREGRKLFKFHAAHDVRSVAALGSCIPLYLVDQVNNAFVARTEFVRSVQWDPSLKLREHDDFALQASNAGTIGYTPFAVVDHAPNDPPDYSAIRNDTTRYFEYFLRKWRLDEVIKEPEWWVHATAPPYPRVLT